MEPRRDELRMYGEVSEHEPLAWSWVDSELEAAPTYWVVAGTTVCPLRDRCGGCRATGSCT